MCVAAGAPLHRSWMLTARWLSRSLACSRPTYPQRPRRCRTARAHADATMAMPAAARRVLSYWFDERFPDWSHDAFDTDKYYTKWFAGGTEVDTEIRETFGADIEAVRSGERDSWRGEPMTCLAGIVLMDQLTRNAFRGTAKMYAADEKAREWAAHFASSGGYKDVHPAGKLIAAMPFEHDEALESQQKCLDLVNTELRAVEERFGPEAETAKMLHIALTYIQRHHDIIAKFGRFPHRNALLGRESTAEEKDGLEDGSIESF